MSYIILNQPPVVERYSFTVDNTPLITTAENLAANLQPSIGNRINPDYENGSKRTPMQTLRLQLIVGAAIAIIAAVGAAIALTLTGCLPLVAVLVPMVVIGIGTLLYRFSLGADFDSPQERAQVVQDIAGRSFRDIAERYADDHLVGYRLLDGLMPQAVDPKKQALFYARFQELRKINFGAGDWRQRETGAVNSIWDRETYQMRDWYSKEQLIIDQQRAIMDQQEAMMRSHTYHREARTGRPATGLRIATAAVSVSNYMTDVELSRRSGDINQIYGIKMDPWNTWRNNSLASVEGVYGGACGQIEHQFTWMKAAAAG